MKKQIHICSLFLLIFQYSISQNQLQTKIIDSLSVLLKTLKEDTTKVNTLNDLSAELTSAGDFEKALYNAQAAKKLSEKLHFKKGYAFS